jgi:hypothetical protein
MAVQFFTEQWLNKLPSVSHFWRVRSLTEYLMKRIHTQIKLKHKEKKWIHSNATYETINGTWSWRLVISECHQRRPDKTDTDTTWKILSPAKYSYLRSFKPLPRSTEN